MFKRLFLIVCLVLSAANPLFSQNMNTNSWRPDFDREPRMKAPESKIRGRIIYEDSGKPVRCGEIGLLRAEDMSNLSGSKTITDDNGQFEIQGVTAGAYFIGIEVPGILNPISYRGFYKTGDNDQKVATKRLETFFRKITTDGVNETEVVIFAKRAAAIAGRVTYADGEPAPGEISGLTSRVGKK